MYGICCLYCLLSFYQSILSSQRRSVTSTSSGAESSVKAFSFICKDNHFFWESILFLLFFSLFSLPCLSHSLSWLSHSLPRLSHSLPWLLHSLPWLSHSLPRLSYSLPLRNLRENIIKKYRILIEKAFTFWAFLSQRVHRFTPFVTFWWIPVKGGFTPRIPSVYRASGADVKGEPSFLALYAYAKENK